MSRLRGRTSTSSDAAEGGHHGDAGRRITAFWSRVHAGRASWPCRRGGPTGERGAERVERRALASLREPGAAPRRRRAPAREPGAWVGRLEHRADALAAYVEARVGALIALDRALADLEARLQALDASFVRHQGQNEATSSARSAPSTGCAGVSTATKATTGGRGGDDHSALLKKRGEAYLGAGDAGGRAAFPSPRGGAGGGDGRRAAPGPAPVVGGRRSWSRGRRPTRRGPRPAAGGGAVAVWLAAAPRGPGALLADCGSDLDREDGEVGR